MSGGQRSTLSILPNPASAWVAFNYDLFQTFAPVYIAVRDLTGRVVYQTQLNTPAGQQIWDTRQTQAGTYIVEVRGNGVLLLPAEKLILQP